MRETFYVNLSSLKSTCVFTRTRNRMNAMCAMKLFVNLVFDKATCVFTRRRNRTSAMCARRRFRQSEYFEKAHASLPLALVNILPHIAHIHTQTQTHTQTHIIPAKKKCPHDAIIIARSNNTESMERMRWIERRRKNTLFNIFPARKLLFTS